MAVVVGRGVAVTDVQQVVGHLTQDKTRGLQSLVLANPNATSAGEYSSLAWSVCLTTPLARRSSMMCGRLSCRVAQGWVLRRSAWIGLVSQPSARSAWRYTTPGSRKRLGAER